MENRPAAKDGPGVPWGPTAAFLVVAADFALITLVPRLPFPVRWIGDEPLAVCFLLRVLLAAAVTAFLLFARNARPASLGFAAGSPREGLRASLLCAAGVALLLAAGAGAALALQSFGVTLLPAPRSSPFTGLAGQLAWNLLAYPLLEEWIYRGLLVPPLPREVGNRGAVLLSGLVFQALHLSYGVYLPHYFVGGAILAWVFLRGRSIWFPVALHALWNLVVVALELSRARGWVPL